MRSACIGIFALAMASCGEPQTQSQSAQADAQLENMMAVDAAGSDSPTLEPTTDGKLVNVSSDPGVTYHLLKSAKMPNGNAPAPWTLIMSTPGNTRA